MKLVASKKKAAEPVASIVVHDCEDAPDSRSREQRIATAAYYKAQSRGFLPGHELEDWLSAERECA